MITNRKDFYKGMAAGFVLSLVVIYSFFRIYWLMEVGLKYFRWHALLWLYSSIALVFFGISYVLYKKGKLKSPRAQKVYLVALGLFAGWYLAEGFLRLTKEGMTYMEQREGVFINPAEMMFKTWYMKWPPGEKLEMHTGEYAFTRLSNTAGFSDDEWTTPKDSNEIRLMTLGDSFTEGDGCATDSAYPKVLKQLLQKEFPNLKITVMNASRRGSDPWFEYKKLHDLLLPYQPDIVVYTNSSNDMFFDHLNYGGMERFKPDTTVTNRIPHHWWLGIFEVSYLFRQLVYKMGYDQSFFSAAQRAQNDTAAITEARQLSVWYSQLAQQNNFTCIQLLRPDRYEIETSEFNFKPQQLTQGLDTLPNYATFDMLAYYRDSLHIAGVEKTAPYFWKIDGHHNATGYALMAQAVAIAVKNEVAKKAETLHR